ncbi:odorant receptor 85b-like [Wyeomyia smithii]|uniref:odorant receptor 85b-like n=1 Tax=Wyeomyia smithii TaxID=174621 RepID=UPI002467B189|nr:odorant receptor 85b-like [Wyeomyia smithii]XP_055533985.1 odorant receptor 85b-like [Wyeomyia smithii]
MKTQVLQPGLKYLQRIGLWGERPRPVYWYYAGIASEIIFLFLPMIAFGAGEEGFDSFACYLAQLIFLGEVVVSFLLFNSQARSFEKMVAILGEIVERLDRKDTQDGIRKFIKNSEKFGRKYNVYVWLMLGTYFNVPLICTLVTFLSKSESERGDFSRLMMMKFYWLDTRRNIVHYGIYWTLLYVACIFSSYQSVLKVTVVSTIIEYGSMMFEFISQKIKNLQKLANDNERRQGLREVIEIHQRTLEYAALLESSVSLSLLNLLSCCMLMLCLMMYYLSKSFGPNALSITILFTFSMLEMAYFCFSGNKLSDKAAEVGEIMYAYAWYLEPVDIQKDIQFVIARSQRLTGITAAKFYSVNRERFAIVIQTSYSYYLILKSTF